MRMTVIPILVGAIGTVSKDLEKENGGIENQRKNRDHPDQYIFKISYLDT